MIVCICYRMKLLVQFYITITILFKVRQSVADISESVTYTNSLLSSSSSTFSDRTSIPSSTKTNLLPSSTRVVTTTEEDYDDSSGNDEDLPAIIGGTIGGVVGVVVVSIVIYLSIRRRGKKMSDPTSAQQSIVAVKNIRFFV